MCLILGATGVGKTLLSKRLQNFSLSKSVIETAELPPIVTTVGSNLTNVNVGRRQDLVIRELGGCMAPIWNRYYTEAHRVVFLIDISNRCQVSASCVQLLLMLRDDRLHQAAVLIVLNKIDMPNAMSRLEISAIMRLDDLIRCAKQKISVVEVSARDGNGVADVVKWLQTTVS